MTTAWEHNGRYVSIKIDTDRCLAVLSPDIDTILDGEPQDIHEILEDVIANSDMEHVAPEDIGALTSGDLWRVDNYILWDREYETRDLFGDLCAGETRRLHVETIEEIAS